MENAKNLADPAFEPTDEELVGLSKRAFAHVRQANEESLQRLRADIAIARQAALERLRQRSARTKAAPP